MSGLRARWRNPGAGRVLHAAVRRLAVLTITAALTAPATAASTRIVNVGDNWFGRSGARPTVKIQKGDTVKWVWKGRSLHNVWATKGPAKFHSRTKAEGSYSRTIKRAGTYKVVCTIHPGMEMTLKAS